MTNATYKPGDRVRLIAPYQPFVDSAPIPIGTTGTVTDRETGEFWVPVTWEILYPMDRRRKRNNEGLLMDCDEIEPLA